MNSEIDGGCHCGNIRFTLDWPEPVDAIVMRQCGCTFCQAHGGSWTSHPDAVLSIVVDDFNAVSRYRFGSQTADFFICSNCGVVPFVISDIEHREYAVVNVLSFKNVDKSSLSVARTDFEGEATDDRLARRTKNWIANVRISQLSEQPALGT